MKRNWTAEQKLAIVLEGIKGEVSVAEICRRHQINQSQYYQWRDKFIEAGRRGLNGLNPNAEIQVLKAKAKELERLIGRQTIEIEILKKTEEIMGNKR